jgi:hypothetical protein
MYVTQKLVNYLKKIGNVRILINKDIELCCEFFWKVVSIGK